MHQANREWWKYCEEKYNKYFHGQVDVIEFGSFNVNGTLRDHFPNPKSYIGVDWREGPCVDLVSFASEVNFDDHRKFDTVISSSMLEHDSQWQNSLANMARQLKENGIMILSWGSSKCKPHCVKHHAVDHKFHPLPAGLVIDFLSEVCELHINEFSYETRFGGNDEYACLVVFRNIRNAMQFQPYCEPLIQSDHN